MSDFKRFVHMEENDDGTMTITAAFTEGQEITGLATIDFDGIFSAMSPAMRELSENIIPKIIHIPNNPDD